MLRSLSSAASGMRARQQSMDVTANNIANVHTTGFKKKTAVFADLVYQTIERRGNAVAPAGEGQITASAGSGVNVSAVRSDMSSWMYLETGRNLDFAITGDGFFRVQLPDGREAYTRDGNFRLDGEGNVVTAGGFQVLFPRLPQGEQELLVSPTGAATLKAGGQETGAAAGQLELAYFNNPQGLLQIGDNLLLQTEAAGAVRVAPPGENEKISQGYLETSNVELSAEMVRLILDQRAFGLSSRALQATDEMWAIANQLRR